ncbi:MAG: hypothetical protein AAFO07_24615 [Bacteroidota bacterium]
MINKSKQLQVFKETIDFLRDHSFEIFDFPDLADAWNRLDRDLKSDYKNWAKCEDENWLRFVIFFNMGYDARYSFSYNFEVDLCKQIWTFGPYVEDYRDEFPLGYLRLRIEHLMDRKLPISKIEYNEIKEDEYELKFKFNETEVYFSDGDTRVLCYNFIDKIYELENTYNKEENIKLRTYNTDPGIMFACDDYTFLRLNNYLGIEL